MKDKQKERERMIQEMKDHYNKSVTPKDKADKEIMDNISLFDCCGCCCSIPLDCCASCYK